MVWMSLSSERARLDWQKYPYPSTKRFQWQTLLDSTSNRPSDAATPDRGTLSEHEWYLRRAYFRLDGRAALPNAGFP